MVSLRNSYILLWCVDHVFEHSRQMSGNLRGKDEAVFISCLARPPGTETAAQMHLLVGTGQCFLTGIA